ncbi:MAG: Gfo/Idh/MocA family oxidoreductase [Kiritimatiellae bacterium]|nr:Gfo/Idh/MocA family oxidoreductase [Kiritimatiellia bacterium]MDD5523105.1 Gfo/Idh/MocA family oxidoreductase [Kiritimatiellia bacterium]
MRTDCSRREFLKRTCCGTVAAPFIFTPGLLGVVPPSQRITLACIGTGLQGGRNTNQFLGDPRVQIVASCDVDLPRAKAMADVIEDHYGRQSGSGRYKGCTVTQDFRELIARDDIDAVMVATPDHTHAVIVVAAMRNGKDIYCEKPLAYSVAEGRAVVETVTRYGRVLQTGTQRRSSAKFRFGCELVRNGRIGKLHTVRVGPGGAFQIRGGFTGQELPQPVPQDFNYDLWLGPAPWVPYTPGRCHLNFRRILDYAEGNISDNGVHFVDLGTWGMNTDLTGPEHIDGTATFPTNGLYDAPTDFCITYTYANGMRLIHSSSETFGVKFEGSEGWIQFSGGDITASSDSILRSEIGTGEIHLRSGAATHPADFIDCVLSRRLPAAHAEIGHRTATVCHLGFISCRLGRPLKWDPVREIFPDDAGANRLLSRAMRAPWSI